MELSPHDTGSGSPPIDPNYFNFVMGHLPPRKTPSNVGDWTLRMVHFPESSPESAWDIHYQNGVGEIHQIRFQQSAKDFFQAEPSKQVVTERGQAKLVENEPLVLEGTEWPLLRLPQLSRHSIWWRLLHLEFSVW